MNFLNFKGKISKRKNVLAIAYGILIIFFSLNIFIFAQSKETPSGSLPPVPNSKKVKPMPTAEPVKTDYLSRAEAEKFYLLYQTALGEDLLDFQKAYDKFFVSEPAIRQYLGRNSLPRNLDICQKIEDAECEKIIAQKINAADLERYYYLKQENEHLGILLWIYAEVFTEADRRGLYKLVESEGFNGLQIVIDPQLLEEAEKSEKNENPVSFDEKVKSLENLNLKYKNHFRQLFVKYSFIKQIIGEMKNITQSAENDAKISSNYYGCQEKACRMLENYFEIRDLKIFRDENSRQLKAFEIFFRMKLF